MSFTEDFEGWAFLELMGHRQLAGHVRTVQLGGSPSIRIDVPQKDTEAPLATQYYSPSALYCLTPTTEENCRSWAARQYPTGPAVLGAGDEIHDDLGYSLSDDDPEEPF